jgi:uncharacterized protein YbaR (Trm112 family)
VEFKGLLERLACPARREPLSSRCERYEMIGEIRRGGLVEAQMIWNQREALQLPGVTAEGKSVKTYLQDALTTRDSGGNSDS